jgi:hypothetical protein
LLERFNLPKVSAVERKIHYWQTPQTSGRRAGSTVTRSGEFFASGSYMQITEEGHILGYFTSTIKFMH